MRVEGSMLLIGALLLAGLLVVVLAYGGKILRKTRVRSGELDDQLVKIVRVTGAVKLAAKRGKITRETEMKLLTHLNDVHEALLAVTSKSGKRSKA